MHKCSPSPLLRFFMSTTCAKTNCLLQSVSASAIFNRRSRQSCDETDVELRAKDGRDSDSDPFLKLQTDAIFVVHCQQISWYSLEILLLPSIKGAISKSRVSGQLVVLRSLIRFHHAEWETEKSIKQKPSVRICFQQGGFRQCSWRKGGQKEKVRCKYEIMIRWRSRSSTKPSGAPTSPRPPLPASQPNKQRAIEGRQQCEVRLCPWQQQEDESWKMPESPSHIRRIRLAGLS